MKDKFTHILGLFNMIILCVIGGLFLLLISGYLNADENDPWAVAIFTTLFLYTLGTVVYSLKSRFWSRFYFLPEVNEKYKLKKKLESDIKILKIKVERQELKKRLAELETRV